jgi:hypothetical protein
MAVEVAVEKTEEEATMATAKKVSEAKVEKSKPKQKTAKKLAKIVPKIEQIAEG